jgi:hypothetical protein
LSAPTWAWDPEVQTHGIWQMVPWAYLSSVVTLQATDCKLSVPVGTLCSM